MKKLHDATFIKSDNTSYELVLEKLLKDGYKCLIVGFKREDKKHSTIAIFSSFDIDDTETSEILNSALEVHVMGLSKGVTNA